MLAFMKSIFKMPLPWRIWVMGLATANMASVFFFPRIEAVVVLVFLMLGAVFQMIIFSKLGFVRLLGLGHFHWIPMLIWIFTRLDSIRPEPAYFKWIMVMAAFNILSLAIDTADVARYLKGQKKPTIS